MMSWSGSKVYCFHSVQSTCFNEFMYTSFISSAITSRCIGVSTDIYRSKAHNLFLLQDYAVPGTLRGSFCTLVPLLLCRDCQGGRPLTLTKSEALQDLTESVRKDLSYQKLALIIRHLAGYIWFHS